MILCIAIGNELRGDDGAAHRLLLLIGSRKGLAWRSVHQLTPELAAELASADRVLFLDADPLCAQPCIEPVVPDATRRAPLAHGMTPEEIVALARRLYGFAGAAFLCRVPAVDFEPGQVLSVMAETGVRSAVDTVQQFLTHPDGSTLIV